MWKYIYKDAPSASACVCEWVLLALNVTKRAKGREQECGSGSGAALFPVRVDQLPPAPTATTTKTTNKQTSDNSHSFPFIAAIIASFALLFHHARIRISGWKEVEVSVESVKSGKQKREHNQIKSKKKESVACEP